MGSDKAEEKPKPYRGGQFHARAQTGTDAMAAHADKLKLTTTAEDGPMIVAQTCHKTWLGEKPG